MKNNTCYIIRQRNGRVVLGESDCGYDEKDPDILAVFDNTKTPCPEVLASRLKGHFDRGEYSDLSNVLPKATYVPSALRQRFCTASKGQHATACAEGKAAK